MDTHGLLHYTPNLGNYVKKNSVWTALWKGCSPLHQMLF